MRMRQIVWLTLLACAATAVPARADGPPNPSLDIAVDGPWIVLATNVVFHNKDGDDAPAIVLMAPGADHATKYSHLRPELISGDGYQIDPGIYCVAFDAECAPKRNGASFTPGTYPAPDLLPVKAAYGWLWFANQNDANARYLILPMPDSYSADGFWYMEFATEFSTDNTKYTDHEVPAIGIQLHYAKGPSSLTLFPCTPSTTVPPIPPGYGTCDGANKSAGGVLDSGTVHITMKNTNFDDVCDPHVRAAYPMMLNLLDPTPLAGANSQNVNKKFAYVDPAIDSSNGTPTFDNTQTNKHCRDNDPQKPPPSGGGAAPIPATPQLMSMQQETQSPLELTTPAIVEELNQVAGELRKQKEKDQGALLAAEINTQANALRGTIPTISQLRLVASLLNASAVAAKNLNLDQLAKKEATLADDTDTKDGKDCKAPIMLIQ